MSRSSFSVSIVKTVGPRCNPQEAPVPVIYVASYQLSNDLWPAWLSGGAILPGAERYADLRAEAVMQIRALGARTETGLILASTKGDMDGAVSAMRGGGALPTLGGEAVGLARAAGLGGVSYAVSTACSSGLSAMVDGACLLLNGEAEEVVVAGVDLAGSFVREGFGSLKAVSATVCRPFDVGRDGLMLGSGAGACLLSRERGEARVGISGFGVASDAVHMTAPDREGRGLMRAMRGALEMAGLGAGEIDVVLAHGTGTRYNDAMEATAFLGVFGANGRPAITAVKGLVGHTLGASGVIEGMLAVKMIEEQVVPGVRNLERPEVGGLDFVMAARRMRVRHVMKVASGFGGLNAAVIFSEVGV